jgi:ketosteroid isomerase-like protein
MVATCFAIGALLAGQASGRAPCWHDDFAAFSFLEGVWRVEVEERLASGAWEKGGARSWIAPDFEGCILVENYAGARGGDTFGGRALYGFNSVDRRLQRVWVDSEHGMLTVYEGARTDDEIVLDYRMVLRGKPTILRDVFFAIGADSFRVENRRSNDDGRTWDVTARLRYFRVPVAEAAAPQPSVDLPPALARVLTDYESAWAAKDETALAALFTEDGFVLPGGQPPVRGRAAIERHYADAGGPLALRALAYSIDGATGYIIGGYARARGEEDIGKFTLTLRMGTDGRWLIVSDMDSSNRR